MTEIKDCLAGVNKSLQVLVTAHGMQNALVPLQDINVTTPPIEQSIIPTTDASLLFCSRSMANVRCSSGWCPIAASTWEDRGPGSGMSSIVTRRCSVFSCVFVV